VEDTIRRARDRRGDRIRDKKSPLRTPVVVLHDD
jgi:hypothetical protein